MLINQELDLENKISILQNKLLLLRRNRRQLNKNDVLEVDETVKKEYVLRKKKGENIDPLIEKIDLETLVGSETFEKVLNIDDNLTINKTVIRGKELLFHTPNMRSLWQSFGQEMIEPELLDFIDQIPISGVFFDIGASTGIFTIYAASTKKHTYCFEPEVANFNILNTNNYLNFKKTQKYLHAFNLAISNKNETSTLYIKHYEPSAHQKIVGKNETRDGLFKFNAEYKQRVLCLTLDQFCSIEKIKPTDVKIDVDGSELDVIEGMQKTLKSKSLKRIFLEVSEKEKSSLDALSNILKFGFSIKLRKRVQNYFNEYNYVLVRD